MRQVGRNYIFFGAPVGLVFTIDRDLERGSWLDFGMFLENVMICARGHQLDTCPQAAIANYPAVLRRELAIGDDQMIVCGMALLLSVRRGRVPRDEYSIPRPSPGQKLIALGEKLLARELVGERI